MALMDVPEGPRIAAQVSPEADDDELRFIVRLGVQDVVLWTDGDRAHADYFSKTRDRFERAGLRIYGFGNWDVHNQDAIVLNLPGRDEKVEQYARYITDLGKAGIPYTTYAHMANGIWSSARESTRGGASARAFDQNADPQGRWRSRRFKGPLTHDREVDEAEIWENFESFIREVAPVAESAGVRIGIHPDDPPGLPLGGVPRCIFSSVEGYRRALQVADSPNVGICFCVGCWLEGGDAMGASPADAIRKFGSQGAIFKVHLRNVDRPLPHFVETFIDDGYADMAAIMEAIASISFDGVIIPDHIPEMDSDPRVGTAYTIGHMKALLAAACRA